MRQYEKSRKERAHELEQQSKSAVASLKYISGPSKEDEIRRQVKI
jgi:hypothetical protein